MKIYDEYSLNPDWVEIGMVLLTIFIFGVAVGWRINYWLLAIRGL